MDILGSLGISTVAGFLGPIITGITNYKLQKLKNDNEVDMVKAESEAMKAEDDANIKVARVEASRRVRN